MLDAFRSYPLSWYSLLVLLLVCSLYVPLQRLKHIRDLTFLGGRAPGVKNGFLGWLLNRSLWYTFNCHLGLNFIWGAVKSFQDSTALDFWDWMFEHNGASAKGSYTAEGTRFL
jgi:hypothetical protein